MFEFKLRMSAFKRLGLRLKIPYRSKVIVEMVNKGHIQTQFKSK